MFSKSLVATTAILTLVFGGLVFDGVAKAQPAASDASMIALTSPGEATTARRLLMNSIGGNNDALHDMLDGVLPWDDYVFQSRLLSMFAMFKAFPGMFRSEPNPWTAEGEAADPARVSLALPEVWDNWETFTAMNEAAADNALKAAFMTREDAKVVVEELEMQCESCHEAFRTSFDSFRDFDDLLPVGNP